MRFLVLLLAVALCNGRPSIDKSLKAALFRPGVDNQIINGQATTPGQFPWQISQQRLGGTWSHSCGAVLLNPTKVLTAAHCISGAATAIIRSIAGLHDRSNPAGSISADTATLITHGQYNTGTVTFDYDIGIIWTSSALNENNINGLGAVRYATLPPDANNDRAGTNCIMSGWGRNTASNTLPNLLLQATIGVIAQADCNTRMAPVSGANVSVRQVCLFDSSQTVGSCNGDSGGPLNCPTFGTNYEVYGVTSWGIQGSGACLTSYPSVYTRVNQFLAWIANPPSG